MMNYPTVDSFPLSILSEPPHTVDRRNVLKSVLLLTLLLCLVVPVITLTTGISSLLIVSVVGLLYAVILVLSDSIFEGLCGAVFVLCTFSANFPLFGIQTKLDVVIQLSVLLVDFAALPLAILFLRWFSGSIISTERRLDIVAGYALTGVVIWSILAAIVSNGPSQFVAFIYSITQIRYLILFGVSVGIVRYIGIRTAIYSLLLAVGGNMLYAIAEVLNRGSIGLSHLGDANGATLGTFYIGPLSFQTSMYAGGFVGSSRTLVALIILVSPLAIERIVRGSTGQRIVAFLYLLASVFLVRVSGSDTGWVAFLLTAAFIILVLTYIVYYSNIFASISKMADYMYGYISTLSAGILAFLLFTGRGIIIGNTGGGTSLNNDGLSNSTSGPNKTGLPNSNTHIKHDVVLPLLKHIPYINTTNLSIRIEQYIAAIKIGIMYPLFGLGGLNFRFLAKSYGVRRRIALHNVYLSYLVSTGIPGAILFLVSIGATLAIAAMMTLRKQDGDRLLWGMIVCGILGFSAYNFWTSAHGGAATYMTFWVFAGVVVGTYNTNDHHFERYDSH